jgi:hypothetical protein
MDADAPHLHNSGHSPLRQRRQLHYLPPDHVDRFVYSRCQGLVWASARDPVIKIEAMLPIY